MPEFPDPDHTSAADRAECRLIIKHFEEQILELEAEHQQLQQLEAGVRRRLDMYSYPFNSLPPEIIEEIFLQLASDYPFCPNFNPTTLLLVCRHWRDIVLVLPRLWRAIDASRLSDEAVLSIWFQRSRDLPISVEFGATVPADFIRPSVVHMNRLEHIRARYDSTVIMSLLSGSLPQLRYLELFDHTLGLGGLALTAANAPLLRAVTMWYPFSGIPESLLPWAQLTALTLVLQPFDICTSILQRTPQLLYCHLVLSGGSVPDNHPTLTVPALQSLTISRFSANDTEGDLVTDYIWFLRLPALKKLRVCELAIRPSPFNAIKDFLTRSGCTPEICITGGQTQTSLTFGTDCPVWYDDDPDEFMDELEQKLSRKNMVHYAYKSP
ncbi:hypothetical protein MIND_00082100 [Mycena indigotica]|uniref:F-box domain-containing protein n=1 Tax=Mycena indigotica TaxID=2126181 RepID=A0A8H6TBE0_9AGAR|nr:uncharacterized protein MIND_00082100 [Mycena indigotica]KAF7315665.1 hypothetical protein MIND_00082100 [Mycena indigotica]